jgi:hypothetical protein
MIAMSGFFMERENIFSNLGAQATARFPIT